MESIALKETKVAAKPKAGQMKRRWAWKNNKKETNERNKEEDPPCSI